MPKWAAGAACVLVLGVYVGHFALFAHQINDDAFITFRCSRNLADGLGPYYNAGEHVEGYTNFLLMLLIAAVVRVGGPEAALPAAKAIGLLAGLGTLVLTQMLCAAWVRRIRSMAGSAALLAWSASAIVAGNTAFALNSTTGLETTLFAFWIALGLWQLQAASDRRGWRGAGLSFALAALTRPEGAWIFGGVVAARLVLAEWSDAARRARLLLDGVVVGAVVGAHTLMRLSLYDGEWLPNTYYAKQGGFAGGGTAAEYAWNFARFHLGGPLALLALLPLGAAQPKLRKAALPALCVVADGVLAVVLSGPDWMPGHRLLVPYAPALAALSVAGAAALCDAVLSRPRPVAGIAAVVLPAMLVAWQTDVRNELLAHVTVRAQGYQRGHFALAEWIRSRATPGETIALMDIGIVGYVCHAQHVLDVTGLTDRTIAKSPGGFLDKQFDPAYVFDRRPEFLVAVLHAPDDGPEPDLRRLEHWTGLEERLLNTRAFAQHYFRPSEPPASASLEERLAGRLGAARVFLHDHPGLYYILAVYERGEPAATQASGE